MDPRRRTRRWGGLGHSRLRRAFTLLEMLLALLISTLVVIGSLSAVRTLTAARENVEGRLQRIGEAQHALEQIVAALANVRRDPTSDEPVLVGRPAGRRELGDRINLLVIDDRRARPEGPESDQYEMSFSLAQLPGRTWPVLLCRKDHAFDDHPDEGGVATVVAEGIVGLTFQYYTGAEWENEWSKLRPGPPEAVRITVTAVRTDGPPANRRPDVVTLSTVAAIGAAQSPSQGRSEEGSSGAPGGPSR